MLQIDFEQRVNAVLRDGLKNGNASVTQHQLAVIDSTCNAEKDVLYVDKTGAGKSETYFVATKLLRCSKGSGPVIVITPFVALMDDQVRRAVEFGLNAFAFYGKKAMGIGERSNILAKIKSNSIDILFITAEMLSEISQDYKPYMPDLLKSAPALRLNLPDMSNVSWSYVPLLVIDEIHMIAEAGHDFRLEYSQVWTKMAKHPWFKAARKLGLTATVNDRVWQSMTAAYPAISEWQPVLGSLFRENIRLRILSKPPNDAARLDYVHQLTTREPAANILVFCKSIKDVERCAKDLVEIRGVPEQMVGFYHSPTTMSDKKKAEDLRAAEKGFREGTIKVLFSTCALGLGYDKSDIHHVVHMWTPNSIVQYYQEFGRVGRTQTGNDAVAHMLPTTPWNPTGWVTVLADICWFLARKHELRAPEALIMSRASSLKHKESDTSTAIDMGIKKLMFYKSGDGKDLILTDVEKSTQEVDKLYAKNMKSEVEVMHRISHNCGGDHQCLWKYILNQFRGDHDSFTHCSKCSGLQCKPGGDIEPDSNSLGNVFYGLTVPASQVQIFALNQVGEDLQFEDERVREIFAMQRPSMVTEPPGKWTICPLPDSTGENTKDAKFLAECLNGMEVSHFISKNINEERKVTHAKSAAERKDILQNKFVFNWDLMPRIGNVLLFDDNVSSGDTIDTVVTAMRQQLNGAPMEFVALTKFVYIGNQRNKVGSPEVRRFIAQGDKEGTAEQVASV